MTTNDCTPEQLTKSDIWAVAEGRSDGAVALWRYRVPVLGPTGGESHPIGVIVLWPYADPHSGVLPTEADMAEMSRFEDLLGEAVECDALAVMAAVLTFDGARQWVFYTRDLDHFVERLSALPDYHGEPYPIEVAAEEDPTWAYLREEILGPVDYDT